jgi:hypothetical protein
MSTEFWYIYDTILSSRRVPLLNIPCIHRLEHLKVGTTNGGNPYGPDHFHAHGYCHRGYCGHIVLDGANCHPNSNCLVRKYEIIKAQIALTVK